MSEYDDIIGLEHFDPKHKRMSIYERAAQFAPFAALSGYEDDIKETARRTNKRIECSEEVYEELNRNIQYLLSILDSKPLIEIVYFVPDKKKEGGEYIIKQGNIKRIDLVNQILKFNDNEVIDLNEVIMIKVVDKID